MNTEISCPECDNMEQKSTDFTPKGDYISIMCTSCGFTQSREYWEALSHFIFRSHALKAVDDLITNNPELRDELKD